MDIQLPQQQEPESPCWGPTLHTYPSHFRRTTGYYTEKNSSQHYLPHPWPPTTISEAGEVPWSHSIGQTILDPTHWDGQQKGEQHTGFSPSEHFQMSNRCQGEMLQKLGLPQPRICKLCMDPNNMSNIQQLEAVQRRAAHFVSGGYHTTSSVSHMISTIGWKSLQHRRQVSKLVMLYRITN